MRGEQLPDYYETPEAPPIRKTGRVCRFCKGTGEAWGIRPMVWTEINKTEEYQSLNKQEKLDLQERFKDNIPCTACKARERLGLDEDGAEESE